MEELKRTPMSASVMDELGFIPCAPRERRSEERIPDRTWCFDDDDSDVLVEWYEDEPHDKYDPRRSYWVLLSWRCRFRNLKYKEELQTLLALMEE